MSFDWLQNLNLAKELADETAADKVIAQPSRLCRFFPRTSKLRQNSDRLS